MPVVSCCFLRPQPCGCVAPSAVTSLMCFDAVSQSALSVCATVPIITRRPGRRDEHDAEQHKGRRGFSDRPRAAVYA